MAKKKFYVVWKGWQTGIFETWDECQNQVKGFGGAEFKSFPNRIAAEAAFAGDYEEHIERGKGKKNATPKRPSPDVLHQLGVELDSIAVDAACSGNPGALEYQGVETRTGERLFHEGVFPEGTVNIGEFLAIVDGLRLLKDQGRDCPIYSDSRVAMGWVSRKVVKTQLTQTKENWELFALLREALAWLKENSYSNRILKWETKQWGEIPADFGRK